MELPAQGAAENLERGVDHRQGLFGLQSERIGEGNRAVFDFPLILINEIVRADPEGSTAEQDDRAGTKPDKAHKALMHGKLGGGKGLRHEG